MLEGVAAAAVLNFIAEFGDKTQLAAFALAGKLRHPFYVFLGCYLGEMAATALGILAGATLLQFIDKHLLGDVSAVAFILLGLWAWSKTEGPDEESSVPQGRHRDAVMTSAAVIFFAEMGDKSQMSNLLLTTQYGPWPVLAGASLGMAAVFALGVYAGERMGGSKFSHVLRKVSAALFVLFGMLTLLT